MDWNLTEAIEYYRRMGAPGDQNAVIQLLREIQREHGGAIPKSLLSEISSGLGTKEALEISFIRIVLSGFAFGISTVPYSLAGGMLSLFVMALLKKSGRFGLAGVSVTGSVCHNVGQTLVAMVLLGANTVYYFPMLLLAGVIAGLLIGIVTALVLQKLKKYMKL